MKNFIYLARYYPSDITFFDEIGLKRNLSVNKKINGILSSLKFDSNSVGVICTSADNPKFNSNFSFFKKNEIKIYVPKFFKSKFRLFSYFMNIISSTFLLRKLYKKNKNTIFICWDYLPDTFLPILFSFLPKKNICIDIEELIQTDPEAKYVFKIFEKIIFLLFHYKYYFLASDKLKYKLPKSSKFYVFNGFFSESLKEENKTIKNIRSKNITSKQECRIFYTGRLDNNRGYDLILDICNMLKNHKNIKFCLFTFGDFDKFIKLKNNFYNENFEFYFEEPRELFIKKISNCSISLNLIKDEQFASNSFPSKLIDYFLFTKIIISTIELNTDFNNHFYTSYNANEIYKLILRLCDKIHHYDKGYEINKKNILKKYSINYHKKNLLNFHW